MEIESAHRRASPSSGKETWQCERRGGCAALRVGGRELEILHCLPTLHRTNGGRRETDNLGSGHHLQCAERGEIITAGFRKSFKRLRVVSSRRSRWTKVLQAWEREVSDCERYHHLVPPHQRQLHFHYNRKHPSHQQQCGIRGCLPGEQGRRPVLHSCGVGGVGQRGHKASRVCKVKGRAAPCGM